MADTAPPRLTSLKFPGTIDVSRGATTIAFDIEAEDEGGSGVTEAVVWVDKNVTTSIGTYKLFMLGSFGDTFRDATPNKASTAFSVSNVTAPGTYSITSVDIRDLAGNSVTYTPAQLQALGINTSFSVVGGSADLSPPTLTGLTLPSVIDVSKGASTVDFKVQADDAGGSGVTEVVVWVDKSVTTSIGTYKLFMLGSFGDTFRDATPNSASTPFTVSNVTAPGPYQVTSVDVRDLAGNSVTYTPAQLQALGFSTSFSVVGGNADVSAPRLTGLALPSVIDVSKGPSTIDFKVQADDAGGSGVTEVVVWVDKSVTTSIGTYKLFILGSFGDTFNDATPNSASTSFAVSNVTAPGTYQVTSVDVRDLAGNSVSYTPAQLQALGFSTSFSVSDGSAPTTPALPAASVSPSMSNGDIKLALTSSDWAAGASNTFSLTVNYDATQIHYSAFSISGGSASFATSGAEAGSQGTVTIFGTGMSAQAQTPLQLTLNTSGAGLHAYAIASFTVNGKTQSLGTAANGGVYRGSDQAELIDGADRIALVDGGAGLDVVKYAGSAASYQVRKSAAGFTVDDGKGLHATLGQVERLVFADKGVALDVAGTGGKMYRLYQAAFDRQPDDAGVGYWLRQMDGGTSLYTIAQNFLGSAEFREKYGAGASSEVFVTALYQNVLHRAPDQAGLDFWVNALAHGVGQADALVQFSESAENVAQVVGKIENGFSYTPFG